MFWYSLSIGLFEAERTNFIVAMKCSSDRSEHFVGGRYRENVQY